MSALKIHVFCLLIRLQQFALQNNVDISLYPKIENFHPPEGYQPVKGFEPHNYRPNRKFNEFTIQTKQQLNFQTPNYNFPAYFSPNPSNPNYPPYSPVSVPLQPNNPAAPQPPPPPPIPFNIFYPNQNFQIETSTRENKLFFTETQTDNWRRTPPSMI